MCHSKWRWSSTEQASIQRKCNYGKSHVCRHGAYCPTCHIITGKSWPPLERQREQKGRESPITLQPWKKKTHIYFQMRLSAFCCWFFSDICLRRLWCGWWSEGAEEGRMFLNWLSCFCLGYKPDTEILRSGSPLTWGTIPPLPLSLLCLSMESLVLPRKLEMQEFTLSILKLLSQLITSSGTSMKLGIFAAGESHFSGLIGRKNWHLK